MYFTSLDPGSQALQTVFLNLSTTDTYAAEYGVVGNYFMHHIILDGIPVVPFPPAMTLTNDSK